MRVGDKVEFDHSDGNIYEGVVIGKLSSAGGVAIEYTHSSGETRIYKTRPPRVRKRDR